MGRSDTRGNLRHFFEVDRKQVAYAALYGLYRKGLIAQDTLLGARDKLGVDPAKPDPVRM